MPLFSFFGLWDSYLSASLYSGNTKRAEIYVSDNVKDGLPETVRGLVSTSETDGANTISIFDWSFEELNVPPYPEDRIFKNVAKRVCEYTEEPSEAMLVVKGKPNPIDGSREAEVYDCYGLKTGEHETLKIERGVAISEPNWDRTRNLFLNTLA
jgi:hypothetical protein